MVSNPSFSILSYDLQSPLYLRNASIATPILSLVECQPNRYHGMLCKQVRRYLGRIGILCIIQLGSPYPQCILRNITLLLVHRLSIDTQLDHSYTTIDFRCKKATIVRLSIGRVAQDMIRIDRLKCTGCNLCVFSCPEGAISCFGAASLDRSKCTDCLDCLWFCPMDAIEEDKGE